MNVKVKKFSGQLTAPLPRENKTKFDGTCFSCGKYDHKSQNCRKPSRWCRNCNNKSHDTKFCRKTKTNHTRAKEGGVKHIKDKHTFIFSVNNTDESYCNLLVNCGATTQILNDDSKFMSFHKNFDKDIFLVQAATENGAKVEFKPNSATLNTQGTTFEIHKKGKLYYLKNICSPQKVMHSLEDWHKIMGHCNVDILKLEENVEGIF